MLSPPTVKVKSPSGAIARSAVRGEDAYCSSSQSGICGQLTAKTATATAVTASVARRGSVVSSQRSRWNSASSTDNAGRKSSSASRATRSR
jgi:hypothetical protein